MEQLQIAIGLPSLDLAEESDLSLLFPGAELGAMPPFGNLFGLPVYLDRGVAAAMRDLLAARIAGIFLPRAIERCTENVLCMLGQMAPD
jgi:hypothetical protein